MLLRIEFESEVPIYQQIKNQIIYGIATQQLKPGEALPSVRQMAAEIGVNFHTVNKVYNQLKQEGWVIIHRKSGVMIHPELKVEKSKVFMEELKNNLQISTAEAYLRGISKEEYIEMIEASYEEYRKKEGE